MFGRRPTPPDNDKRAITAWGSWDSQSSTTYSGTQVTTNSALQLLAVYGCVRLIADGISTLPIDVLRRRPDGTIEDIALPSWLEYPVTGLHRSAWLTQVLSSVLLAGNAFIAVMRTDTRISELPVLDPAKVRVVRREGRRQVLVNGAPVAFDVLHIPAVMLPGEEVGISPVEYARQSIGVGLAAQEFGARFFGQGAVMSGVIENPGPLTPSKTREMAQAWGRAHSGKAKAHLPGVLTDGATWKPTSVTNEQAQFLETRGFTAAEIAGQMFLVDPTDLGIPSPSGQSQTYANVEQRNIRRVQVTYLPWLVRLEAVLSPLLAAPSYVKFNVNGLLRGDTKSRFEAYKIGIDEGFLTANEARAFEDWSPIDEPEPSFTEKVESVGALIRAGFEPQASLAAVGLPPIPHTGLPPVTVQTEELAEPDSPERRLSSVI